MCQYCELAKITQAKLGLLLGYPKCCIKSFINKDIKEDLIISYEEKKGIYTMLKTKQISLYNKEKEMVMCKDCALLYEKNKEAQLSKFKKGLTFPKALMKLNIKK